MTSSVESGLKAALRRVTEDSGELDVDALTDETDILGRIDSFSIVNLLLESEMLLEESTGRYVALADEDIFDASRSPLRRWSDWVAHVEKRHAL